MTGSNYIIFKSLLLKETKRFLKVYNQTILSPIITALIFYLIFVLALGDNAKLINGIPYEIFIGSGIIAMTMMQQSFANSSSSITVSKINGTFIDYQITPISNNCFVSAFTLAATIRGVFIGLLTFTILSIFINIKIHHFIALIYAVILGNLILSLFGVITGIVSRSFEQMSSFTTYFVTPLSFLSGTFYSVKKLPPLLEAINYGNPFFYIIDMFRYGVTGYHDADLTFGAVYLLGSCVFLYMTAYTMVRTGYKIKS